MGGKSPVCADGASAAGEIMLFGVRVKVDPMRKSVSMNNLSEYVPVAGNNMNPNDCGEEVWKGAAEAGGGDGYGSADAASVPQPFNGNRERKRGVPWTEDEHKLFLIGLQKVGKGDWRGISRNYVKTRTPTQVASHAQKYFLRRSNLSRRRRRTSLFDITTDSVTAMPMEEENKNYQESLPQSPMASDVNGYPVMPFLVNAGPVLLSMQGKYPVDSSPLAQSNLTNSKASPVVVLPVPSVSIPMPSAPVDLNLNQRMATEPSLNLSLASGHDQPPMRASAFLSFKTGDNTISVA